MRRWLCVICLTLSVILTGSTKAASGQTTAPKPPANLDGLERLAKVLIAAERMVTPEDTLRGLPGLKVVVEHLEPDAEQDGLHEADIQTDVELQLRLAGITVPPRDKPFIFSVYVNVNTVKGGDGVYAYSIRVGVNQPVRLGLVQPDSGDQTATATTWNTGAVGRVGATRLREVREGVKDHVNQLINDWLAVNPKK